MSTGAFPATHSYRMKPSAEPKTAAAPVGKRRRGLPATQMRLEQRRDRGAGLVSTLLHILLIMLLIAPQATHIGDVVEREMGAGGAGPAGGGGGGHRGTGGIREHVTYVQPVQAPEVSKPAVVPPPV